jgi:hypothetical protein
LDELHTDLAMNLLRDLSFSFAITAAAFAAPQKAVYPDSIKDKVCIKLGQELTFKFQAEGARLIGPRNLAKAGDPRGTVKIKLKTTDSTPFRVRGVATRPYLVVSNGFEKTLRFRAFTRLKGSRQFFEIDEPFDPVPAGEEALLRCWESGSLVEEILLCEFTLGGETAR